MKLTSSGRTQSAAMSRSPSFSRSSSSIITTILPRFRSSRISSIVLSSAMGTLGLAGGEEPIQVAGDLIDLDINAVAIVQIAQGRHLTRMRNDIHIEACACDLVHSQADSVDTDRPLGRGEARELDRQLEVQAPGTCIFGARYQSGHAVDVPAHQ